MVKISTTSYINEIENGDNFQFVKESCLTSYNSFKRFGDTRFESILNPDYFFIINDDGKRNEYDPALYDKIKEFAKAKNKIIEEFTKINLVLADFEINFYFTKTGGRLILKNYEDVKNYKPKSRNVVSSFGEVKVIFYIIYEGKEVIIDDNCWSALNAIINN